MFLYGYEFRSEHGHTVIYKDGRFYGHAQSIDEALTDLRKEEEEAKSE